MQRVQGLLHELTRSLEVVNEEYEQGRLDIPNMCIWRAGCTHWQSVGKCILECFNQLIEPWIKLRYVRLLESNICRDVYILYRAVILGNHVNIVPARYL